MDNKFLNARGVIYLWNKITQKFASKDEIASLASSVVEGYYYDGQFYENPERTSILPSIERRIYIDVLSGFS